MNTTTNNAKISTHYLICVHVYVYVYYTSTLLNVL